MRTKTVHKWVYPVRDIRGNIIEPGRWEQSTITVPDPPKRRIAEIRTKTVHDWVHPVRDVRGNIIEPGYWEERTITVPEEHNEVTGCMWVVLAVIFIAALFAIAWLNGDSDPGKCRTELGYMGQVEVVDCEER